MYTCTPYMSHMTREYTPLYFSDFSCQFDFVSPANCHQPESRAVVLVTLVTLVTFPARNTVLAPYIPMWFWPTQII